MIKPSCFQVYFVLENDNFEALITKKQWTILDGEVF